MKSVLALGLWLLVQLSALADNRIWTIEETGEKVEAVILEKNTDGSRAQLERKNSTPKWIETASFIEADREFVRLWVPAEKLLTCRVVKTDNQAALPKTVQVTAYAGPEPMKVVARKRASDKKPVVKKLKKGETVEFTYRASNQYVVKALRGKKVVDMESWEVKTGL